MHHSYFTSCAGHRIVRGKGLITIQMSVNHHQKEVRNWILIHGESREHHLDRFGDGGQVEKTTIPENL